MDSRRPEKRGKRIWNFYSKHLPPPFRIFICFTLCITFIGLIIYLLIRIL